MVSVILDSNIYGKLAIDDNSEEIVEKIIRDKKFVIVNFRIIRNELRKAPKQVLTIYDSLVSKNIFDDNRKISILAKEYYKEYKKNGGNVGLKNIINDLKIVAFSSIKNCDLVFSDDERTLKSFNSINAYKTINLKYGYRTPTFYSYSDIKKLYLT